MVKKAANYWVFASTPVDTMEVPWPEVAERNLRVYVLRVVGSRIALTTLVCWSRDWLLHVHVCEPVPAHTDEAPGGTLVHGPEAQALEYADIAGFLHREQGEAMRAGLAGNPCQ